MNKQQIQRELYIFSKQEYRFGNDDAERIEVLAYEIRQNIKRFKLKIRKVK